MNTNSLSPQMVLSLWVIPAKGTRQLSMRISTTCKLNSHLSLILGGTIFLGNTIQRDKTTKSEDIYEM